MCVCFRILAFARPSKRFDDVFSRADLIHGGGACYLWWICSPCGLLILRVFRTRAGRPNSTRRRQGGQASRLHCSVRASPARPVVVPASSACRRCSCCCFLAKSCHRGQLTCPFPAFMLVLFHGRWHDKQRGPTVCRRAITGTCLPAVSIECSVCSEELSASIPARTPRLLVGAHTFCTACLDKLRVTRNTIQ